MMFDAHSASMACWEERAALEAKIWYTEATVSLMRWRVPHRSHHGDERLGGLNVAAGRLLGYRTRAA
jgi:hypothetical protein